MERNGFGKRRLYLPDASGGLLRNDQDGVRKIKSAPSGVEHRIFPFQSAAVREGAVAQVGSVGENKNSSVTQRIVFDIAGSLHLFKKAIPLFFEFSRSQSLLGNGNCLVLVALSQNTGARGENSQTETPPASHLHSGQEIFMINGRSIRDFPGLYSTSNVLQTPGAVLLSEKIEEA